MNRFYLAKFIVLGAILLGLKMNTSAQTVTFSYTGAVQTYTVPAGVTFLKVDMSGGSGGNASCSGVGGTGGRVQCNLAVTPFQVLNVYVGGQGTNYNSCCTVAGGFNGGGTGYENGGGGGGGSDIRIGGTALGNRKVVAGGGGGAGQNWCNEIGGCGGGLVGTVGTPYTGAPSNYSGGGGTQSAGGAGATYCCGGSTAGSLGIGGGVTYGYGGGGGGGGYYGGGSGDYYCPGGGGSGYTDPSLCSGVVFANCYNTGNGIVTICSGPIAGAITGTATICPGTSTTLTNPTGAAGGAWSTTSSNVTVALSTGVVTGVAPGTAIVSYTATNSCTSASTYYTVTINPLPATITGPLNDCVGASITLADTDPAGVWTSSNPLWATINSTSGVVTGLVASAVRMSYTLPTGCVNTKLVSINPLPAAFTVTGGGAYCSGTGGVHVGLSASFPGISYQLYNGSTAVGTALTGTGGALDFGLHVSTGVRTVVATDPTSTCATTMTGSVTVTINPLPPVNNVTGGIASYCSGGTGVDVGLDGSASGINYQLYDGVTAVGVPVAGSGTTLDFGPQTGTGSYTAVATDAVTGCVSNMLGGATVSINPLPLIHSVTGGGNFCVGGTGVHVILDGSNTGINYQVYYGSVMMGSPVSGTGSILDFGAFTGVGSYTVLATNVSTGCTNIMSGAAIIAVNPLPTAYSVTGGGNYCTGGTGSHVGLDFSGTGVNYQLYNGTSHVGSPVAGSEGPIDFGLEIAPGTYTVKATNPSTGCASNMTGSTSVSILPLPTVELVSMTGTGYYCAGGTGVAVNLNGSQASTTYQLYLDGTAVGIPAAGTGSNITFGPQTGAGVYTAVATNTSTTCMNNMSGSATVNINPLPNPYIVTGGGNYCIGGTGVAVNITGSDNGVNYQLYHAGAIVGAAQAGNGTSLSFGLKTLSGDYTVVATNTSTGCASNMSGAATITINPLPSVFSITGGGNYCLGGLGRSVGLSFSSTGVNYQLYLGGTAVGGALPGSGSALDFGSQTSAGVYTIVANNTITGCSSNMLGTATITTTGLPAIFPVSGGGSYCTGGTGVRVGLSASNSGIHYQLFNGTATVGSAFTGTGGPLDFGMQTVPGIYTVTAINTATSCTNNMAGSASVLINPMPSSYTVSGGGSFCAGGTGVGIGLATSDTGVSYQLYDGSSRVGVSIMGTGSALAFGTYGVSGTYTVRATDLATTCTGTMSGAASVLVNPLPSAYTVTGGGAFCAGAAGVAVGIDGSSSGVWYQLYNDTSAVTGALLSGTGGALSFGTQSAAGVYSVRAVNGTTSCTQAMTGGANVVVNPLPVINNVTGGGSYCAGGIGVAIGLDNTSSGISYQLYRGSSRLGSPWAGTGTLLGFGTYATPGMYTVVATNPVTGCTSNQNSSATVTVTPLVPASVTISATPGFTVCAGMPITLTANPVNGGTPGYTWKVNGSASGTDSDYVYVPVDGDVVSVTMTSNVACATPASVTMEVPLHVLVNQTPVVNIVSDKGDSVCQATLVTYNALPTYGGTAPTYSWSDASGPIGSGIHITLPAIAGETIHCTMTSNYACVTDTTAVSNTITTNILMPVAPTFSLTAAPGNTIGLGQVDTFTIAHINGGGPNPTFQWYLNGTLVPGETNQAYITNRLSNLDTVSCTVTGSGMCGGLPTSNSMLIHVRNVGVQQVNMPGSDISVIPNPNNGNFTIKGTLGTNADETVSVEIVNMVGQVVYQTSIPVRNGSVNERIQVGSTLANGMYLLNLHSSAGNSVFHMVIEQ